MYEELVVAVERVEGKSSPLLATVSHNAALGVMEEPVDVPKALALTEKVIEVAGRILPAESRQMGFFWLGRSSALLLGQQPEEALSAALKADAVFALSADESHSMIAEGELLAAVAEARLGHVSAVRQRMQALGARRALVDAKEVAQRLANTEPLIGEMK